MFENFFGENKCSFRRFKDKFSFKRENLRGIGNINSLERIQLHSKKGNTFSRWKISLKFLFLVRRSFLLHVYVFNQKLINYCSIFKRN